MPSHAAKFVAAIFVTVLASLPLVTMARSETTAAASCLSAPGSETPAGSHWRYRVDHVDKRNCWYLHRADGLAQARPQSSPRAPAQPAQTPVQAAKPSVADAHAELRSRAANDDNAATTPPANAAASEASPATSPSVWNAEPTVATRWPELPPAYQMPRAEPAAASSADNNAAQTPAEAPQATDQPTAFGYFSLPMRPETIPTLLAALLGALAFGSAAALISRRRGQMRRLRGRVTKSAVAPLSETTDDDRIILSDIPDSRDYRPRFGRDAGTSAVADDRSQEFVRRAPRYAHR
jgi:hypothetical protein